MESKKVRNSRKGLIYMELAKITSKGQITIPIGIRKKLGLKDGDKVLFLEEGNKVVMVNSTLLALKEAQKAFEGEAEKAGIKDEQDIIDLIKQIRKEG